MLVQRAAGDLIWSKNTVNGFATSQLLAMFIWQNGRDGFHRASLPDLIVRAALCCGDCHAGGEPAAAPRVSIVK